METLILEVNTLQKSLRTFVAVTIFEVLQVIFDDVAGYNLT